MDAVRAVLSDTDHVDNTVYESYDDGDPNNNQAQLPRGNAWHRRISPETYIWVVVMGAVAGLWLIAGSFRKVLS